MPEPNLPPLRLRDSDGLADGQPHNVDILDVAHVRTRLPELPQQKRER